MSPCLWLLGQRPATRACEPCGSGGDEQNRTVDPLLARQVLSQLSYAPISTGLLLAPGESTLSAPLRALKIKQRMLFQNQYFVRLGCWNGSLGCHSVLHRKEVIQPHLPIRLPCYDFTPVANPTFGSALLAVTLLTSGITGSHGVTGGVYKARERIHRGMLIRDY